MRHLLLPLVLLLAFPLHAEEPAGPPGKRYNRVPLREHPDQFYAAWLPDAAREQPTPLLVVLDPRGRAQDGLDLFLPAAKRLGWIVVSSYESRSDEGSERNADVLPALLKDLEKRMLIDDRRVYFAGFSGTARAAYAIATSLGEHAAGVIANCGTLPPGVAPRKPSFAYFGATGTLDYNYTETLRLEQAFAELGAERRFEIFSGEHSWGPPEMMRRAVYWLELQAMKKELRPRDPALVAEIFAADLVAAEAAAQPLPRLLAYRQLERDFGGLAELGDLPAKRAALEKDPAVRDALEERGSLLDLETGYLLKIGEWQTAFMQTELPLPLNRSLSMLLIPSLESDAKRGGDLALSAERRLRMAFSTANHYLPTRLVNGNRLRQAAASYELATRIRPTSVYAHLNLARAELRIGRETEARKALSRALELGAEREQLAADALLAPLLEKKTAL